MAADPQPAASKPLRVLVVAGGHRYDQPQFRAMFKNYAGMNCTFIDEKKTAEAFDDITDWPYDAVVLYNYYKKPTDKQLANITKLLDKGTGLVILHHAIYGYKSWPEYQKLVGRHLLARRLERRRRYENPRGRRGAPDHQGRRRLRHQRRDLRQI